MTRFNVTPFTRQTYTVIEAAVILGLGTAKVYQAVRDGTIPSIRIGRRFLIPRAALEKMFDDAVAAPQATPVDD